MSGFEVVRTIAFMKLKVFWGAGILITTKCSTGCKHCIYGNLKREDITKETIKKGLKLFKKLNINVLGISGGEPFESYDNLIFLIKEALEFFSPKKLFLITSANWANTSQEVKEKLDPLFAIGLKNLIISIDSFHIEKISPRNYFLILNYLNGRGISPVISVRYNNEINKQKKLFETIKTEYDVKIFTKKISKAGKAALLKDDEIIADGKGIENFRKNFDTFYVNNYIRPQCLQLTLFPDGDIHLCCVKKENTKICNINTDDFFQSLRAFNKNWKNNLYKGLLKSLDYTDCNNCPISKR